MKKLLILFLSAIFLLACGSEDGVGELEPSTPSPSEEPTEDKTDTTKVEVPGVEAARPTDWQVTCQVDPTTSMTMTIELSGLPEATTSDDLMASFVNDECRGITQPLTEYGMTRFYLPVARALNDDPDNMPQVIVRYYSAKAGRIYTMSDSITFERDGHLGTPTNPFIPVWK